MDRQCGDRAFEVVDLSRSSSDYFSRDELDAAINYAEQSLELATEQRHVANETASLTNISNGYWLASEFDKALEYQLMALELSRSEGDRENETIALFFFQAEDGIRGA